MKRDATFSPCHTYRYTLWRSWGDDTPKNFVMFIGLNPSTADAFQDDPTIRRCIGFAQSWGYGALCMANLFAFRATEPADMRAALDPIGPDNDKTLTDLAACASKIVAAWGTHGAHLGRDKQVLALLPDLYCLRQTKQGHPAHPLYLPKTLSPIPYTCST